ncbi:MAG: pyrroline-5-carboxylate reductase [Phycisphaerae bacterium]|nr:pyrroline-5-carboxylate reductase [Phycisphaerae bacterium]
MADYELGIIGAGNMAEAIVRGVLRVGVLAAERIVAGDPNEDRRRAFQTLGVDCVADNAAPAAQPRVLLAVKPQILGQVCQAVAEHMRPDATVMSIAAGVPTRAIDEHLGGRGRIVRVMPNTPMLVGVGAAALAGGPRAEDDDVRWAEGLFAASGSTVVLAEPLLDAVTAVSGSGPAYVFYLVEAMIEAGVEEGLPAETARLLAVQTCAGAAALLDKTGEAPETLRHRVTSPGGTTEQAIAALDADAVKDALVRAVRAAAERSRDLGG